METYQVVTDKLCMDRSLALLRTSHIIASLFNISLLVSEKKIAIRDQLFKVLQWISAANCTDIRVLFAKKKISMLSYLEFSSDFHQVLKKPLEIVIDNFFFFFFFLGGGHYIFATEIAMGVAAIPSIAIV